MSFILNLSNHYLKDEVSKKPLVKITHQDNFNDQTYSFNLRVSFIPKLESLEKHLEILKTELEKMLVEKVKVIDLENSYLAFWFSDAFGKPTNFAQFLATESNESDSIVIMNFSSDEVSEIDQSKDFIEIITKSLSFKSETSKKDWKTYYNIEDKFGFLFDSEKYYKSPSPIPMTEVSLLRNIDVPDESKQNLSCIVRRNDKDIQIFNLDNLGVDLLKNLKDICQNTLKVMKNESSTIATLEARLIIAKGTPKDSEELIFAYKYLIYKKGKIALLFAFSSILKEWESEWQTVEEFINTLYFEN